MKILQNYMNLWNLIKLNSDPESNAFADFEKWDKVIIDGFGGHNFIKM